MSTTQTVTWNREQSNLDVLRSILDHVKSGDPVNAHFRGGNGTHSYTVSSTALVQESKTTQCAKITVGESVVRSHDDSIPPNLVSVTVTVQLPTIGWATDAEVVMDATGDVFRNVNDQWYSTRGKVITDPNDLVQPVQVLVDTNGRTCLSGDEVNGIIAALIAYYPMIDQYVVNRILAPHCQP